MSKPTFQVKLHNTIACEESDSDAMRLKATSMPTYILRYVESNSDGIVVKLDIKSILRKPPRIVANSHDVLVKLINNSINRTINSKWRGHGKSAVSSTFLVILANDLVDGVKVGEKTAVQNAEQIKLWFRNLPITSAAKKRLMNARIDDFFNRCMNYHLRKQANVKK